MRSAGGIHGALIPFLLAYPALYHSLPVHPHPHPDLHLHLTFSTTTTTTTGAAIAGNLLGLKNEPKGGAFFSFQDTYSKNKTSGGRGEECTAAPSSPLEISAQEMGDGTWKWP
uniref:Dirigent protein n=1 Tax=Oryza barthii TaxID=65489 RepID=A0A0D3EXB3_9ORYZ